MHDPLRLITVEPVDEAPPEVLSTKKKALKRVRPFAKGTFQYLTFTGPGFIKHPIIRSESCTFLGTRAPKFAGMSQEFEYRQAL